MKSRLFFFAATLFAALGTQAQETTSPQMEKLDRGTVALPVSSGSGNFVSWRLLGTDDEELTTFDILRNGMLIKSNQYLTNYTDAQGTASSTYQIVTKVNGVAVDTSKAVKAWSLVYNPIKLDRPADGKTKPYSTTINKESVSFPNGQDYSYTPNDMSVGDVDGDGEYELFVKWDPSNSKDNSQNGVTGIVYIDCYKLDGTKLWRVNLGQNIRAGAHYTQFLVYDFNGDGRAEMICKTAPGSQDGQGNYVNQAATLASIKNASNTKDWVSEGAGRINGGHEYLTVFDGQTGRAIHTIAYVPNRNATIELSEAAGSFNWGVSKSDAGSYGNRGERYLAGVAHLDGHDKNASGIFCRGYYTYAHVWAVDFDGSELHPRWLHSSETTSSYKVITWTNNSPSTKTYTNCKPTCGSGSGTMYGNGNHNMSVADVDGDGCDEIIWGSAACDNNGRLLYGTGFGHGDAIHLGDHCPDRPGLEVFQVHEEKGTYAWDLHDAATGEILLKGGPEGVDNGRGIAGQFDANVRGSLFWSSSDGSARKAISGEEYSTKHGSSNFRIYWDGDLQEELLDGGKIDKWNGNGTSRVYLNGKNLYDLNSSSSCNSTKATPCLQADILGDWREEVILWSAADNATINIFTTNTTTNYRMPTLMHDHTYRMGVAWQNTAYNQPPHLGYYLPDAMMPHIIDGGRYEIEATVGDSLNYKTKVRYAKSVLLMASIMPDGTKKGYNVPEGFERPSFSSTTKELTLRGVPQEKGNYQFALKITGMNGETVMDTLIVKAKETTGIAEHIDQTNDEPVIIYDTAGRRLPQTSTAMLPRGLYILKQGKRAKKILVQ
ncbi:MAG: rhamnogalacturonan lyase [Prevotella sp.]|nr:rhamnogalacturonan lyase [Prevotella sp.]